MGWQNLGAVETIYEEVEEDYDFSSSSSSSDLLSSPHTPLHFSVDRWSLAKDQKTDVLIRVHGMSFHLHKDPLASRSVYLKRHLTHVSDLTLSPPLNITPETFTLVVNFCYGAGIVITPFNVAALRTAAELLEMMDLSDADADTDEDSLINITENYFQRAVGANREYALLVFRSCLDLLPESETMAFLVSRCIEAWTLEVDGNGDVSCFDDVRLVGIEDFQVIVESMHRRFLRQDVLYKIIELYFKGLEGELTEDQKTQICNFIDCNKLTPRTLIRAVQNSVMPMRFIVRAMLVEQLNTRLSIVSHSTTNQPPRRQHHRRRSYKDVPVSTLGAILQRDAALRDAAKLKATMDATSWRIQSLEKELIDMKKKLDESEKQRSSILYGGRSASFHYGSDQSKVRRGEIGSASPASFRRIDDLKSTEKSTIGRENLDVDRGNMINVRKNTIGQRLINGIKKLANVSAGRNGANRKKDLSGTDGDDDDGVQEDQVYEDDEEQYRSYRNERRFSFSD